jgi:predicted  nucleic acid-binding Zn-ribbon protein
VSASTGKSTYKCDSCKKLTGDTTNEHSIAKSNQKEALSTDILCYASRIEDNNDSLSAQLEAVRANGICTMEMVSNLSSEEQQLRIDNESLKTQLRDLHQVPYHVPSTRREAASCAIYTT